MKAPEKGRSLVKDLSEGVKESRKKKKGGGGGGRWTGEGRGRG